MLSNIIFQWWLNKIKMSALCQMQPQRKRPQLCCRWNRCCHPSCWRRQDRRGTSPASLPRDAITTDQRLRMVRWCLASSHASIVDAAITFWFVRCACVRNNRYHRHADALLYRRNHLVVRTWIVPNYIRRTKAKIDGWSPTIAIGTMRMCAIGYSARMHCCDASTMTMKRTSITSRTATAALSNTNKVSSLFA